MKSKIFATFAIVTTITAATVTGFTAHNTANAQTATPPTPNIEATQTYIDPLFDVPPAPTPTPKPNKPSPTPSVSETVSAEPVTEPETVATEETFTETTYVENTYEEESAETDYETEPTQTYEPAPQPNPQPAPQPDPNTPDYTLYSSYYCGDQTCSQAAVDGNDVSYVVYDEYLTVIAGHNYGSAGIILNFEPGDIVQVHGVGEGLYRITHNRYYHYNMNRLNMDTGFAFQTCTYGDDIKLAYAVKIG